MKKIALLITAFMMTMGFAQAQDVYVSGNHFTTGKVLKNNTLLYSITDSIDIQLKGIQVSEDGTVYGAGYAYNSSDNRGRVWMNDSCIFIADTNTYFDHISLNGNNWTVAGGNNVWQNGELLYSYSHGEDDCHIHDLAVDTTTGDIYAGGAIYLSGEYLAYASVWKNDSLLWLEDTVSSVENICFDGGNLYAAGFKVANDSLSYGVIWQNDSIIHQMENANFVCIAAFEGSLYWTGISLTDTVVRIWQDGEVLYSLPELSGISNLVVNESGVYYTDAETVYKDGEVLYQPAEWCIISDLVVKPAPPQPTYNITVESDHLDWGSVSGGGTYPEGDTIQIEAIPNAGYEFLMWNDSITDNPRNIVVTQDSTFVASFGRIQYTITVESDNLEWGNVSGGGTFYYGDTIEIAATSNLGFEFVNWTDGNNDNPRTVIVTENQTYTAHFGIQQCLINTEVIPEGAGTINGGGTYDYGATIHLTAHNNTGYAFSQWSDGDLTNPRSILVEGDATYTAVFTPLQYEISTASDPVEGGTVTGAGTYDYGSTATLTATASENYMFICWHDGIVTNPRNVTVTGNITYTALFHLVGSQLYTITLMANDPTLGTVTGSGTYVQGSTVQISATPVAGAFFMGWSDGNTNNPRSIVVTQNATYTALFERQHSHIITVRSDNPNWGDVSGGGVFPEGSTIVIEALPHDNYYFAGWQDGNMDNPRQVIVVRDSTFIANFSNEPVLSYYINVQYLEEQGYILGAGTYLANSTATLAAIPYDGYHFVKWGDGNTDNPRHILVTQNLTLSAFFDSADVAENGDDAIILYPNPTDGTLHLKGIDAGCEISIYNVFGTCVKREWFGGNEISVEGLPAGLYLIQIDGKHALRFVKQ